MRIERRTPVLDAVRAVLAQLSGHYEFTMAALDRGLSSGNAVKLESLIDADRRFLDVTPELKRVAHEAFAKAFAEVVSKGGAIRVEYLLNQIGLAIRNHIVTARFEGQTDMTRMEPLSPAWAARKRREGRSANVGTYKGTLKKNLKRSPFRLRKVR